MRDLPPSLEESILEARKSLDLGNSKSSNVMSRHTGGNILREISVYSLNAEIFEHLVSLAESVRKRRAGGSKDTELSRPEIALKSMSERCRCE
jgi:hypothetical protein